MKSIKSKLFISYLIFVLFILFVGTLAIYSIGKVNRNGQTMYDEQLVPVINLSKIVDKAGNIRLQMVQALLRKDITLAEQAIADLDLIEDYIKKYEERKLTSDELETFSNFKTHWGTFNQRVQKNTSLMKAGKWQDADQGIRAGREEYNTAHEDLQELIEIGQTKSQKIIMQNTESYSTSITFLISALVISIIFAIAIAIIMGNKFGNSIKSILKMALEIAEGDLMGKRISVKSKDEFGQLANAFNHMVENLRTLINEVKTTAEQVAASSEELMASSEETTAATNQVSSSILEVSNTIEIQGHNTEKSVYSMGEVAIGIHRIAESTSSVADGIAETSIQANNGNDYIHRVVEQMDIIYNVNAETKAVMDGLERRTNEIGEITYMITDIAEQTNLLALNAAIEAARAGEHGKGFAIVADEVRKLAVESKQSASKIAEIMQQVQNEMLKAAEMTNDGNKMANSGINLVNETGKVFEKILHQIEQINEQAHEISTVSEQLSASAQQVNFSIEDVGQLAKVTTANIEEIVSSSEEQLATMEEVAASATILADMAEKLKGAANKFKL